MNLFSSRSWSMISFWQGSDHFKEVNTIMERLLRRSLTTILKTIFSRWVYLGIFLLWSVNHSIHKRNENYFFTWVSLSIFLVWNLNLSFHKRNENDFFTWVSLGIFLLWSVNHSFHKRNENDYFAWVSLGIFLLFSVKLTKIAVQKLGLNFWDIRLGLEKKSSQEK